MYNRHGICIHVAEPSSNAAAHKFPQILSGIISKYRVRSKIWVQQGKAPNSKYKQNQYLHIEDNIV